LIDCPSGILLLNIGKLGIASGGVEAGMPEQN